MGDRAVSLDPCSKGQRYLDPSHSPEAQPAAATGAQPAFVERKKRVSHRSRD